MEQGIEVLNKPKKGDILIFTDKGYKNVSFKDLLRDVNKNILDLQKQLLDNEKTILELKSEIRYLKGEE